MNTTEVENFPGFPDGIMGPDLMAKLQEQAERFGTEVVYDDVVELELDGDGQEACTLGNGETHEAASLIYATGSAYRKLGLADEERLSGHGVSWCATCDGFFFRQKTIAVVGGGDSAMEEATFLTRFADKVYVIHRRDALRASKIMQERAFANPKIEFIWNSEVAAHLRRRPRSPASACVDTVDGRSRRRLDLSGLFVAIGADPRTHLVHGQLDLTPEGTIAVEGRTSRTNIPGVFAAGDVVDPHLPPGGHRRGLGHGRRARRRALPRRAPKAPEAEVAGDGIARRRPNRTASRTDARHPPPDIRTDSTERRTHDCTRSHRRHVRAGGAELRQADHGRLLGRVVRPVPRRVARSSTRSPTEHSEKIEDRQAQRRREPRDGDEVPDHLDPGDEGLPRSGEVVKTVIGAKPKPALEADLAEFLA